MIEDLPLINSLFFILFLMLYTNCSCRFNLFHFFFILFKYSFSLCQILSITIIYLGYIVKFSLPTIFFLFTICCIFACIFFNFSFNPFKINIYILSRS
uniref:Candidate secreted effector n=1 Tax=Meloidogyne incognita TaxID=6306 RepID=A0A914MJV0_MELIC